jgi:hypothetical protein
LLHSEVRWSVPNPQVPRSEVKHRAIGHADDRKLRALSFPIIDHFADFRFSDSGCPGDFADAEFRDPLRINARALTPARGPEAVVHGRGVQKRLRWLTRFPANLARKIELSLGQQPERYPKRKTLILSVIR